MSGPGRGVPGRFPPAEIAEVKALACELPAESGRPLSRWSAAELAREAVARGIVCSVSGTTVWRWLAADAIRPWAWRSWVFPRDPDFRAKASRVLDLYERRWEGRRLHPGDYVISADEKTQLQALARRHALVGPAPGRPGLVEHEYRRGGTLAYLAAMDVHDPGRGLFGRCEPKVGNDPFDRLVQQVMSAEPYASARRVFWVVDNGTSHRGQPSIERLQGAWPNLVLVHLPRHASWLNQIEIYFSILPRKALTPCHFADLDELAKRILGFQAEFRRSAQPFDWTFTRADLHTEQTELLHLVDECPGGDLLGRLLGPGLDRDRHPDRVLAQVGAHRRPEELGARIKRRQELTQAFVVVPVQRDLDRDGVREPAGHRLERLLLSRLHVSAPLGRVRTRLLRHGRASVPIAPGDLTEAVLRRAGDGDALGGRRAIGPRRRCAEPASARRACGNPTPSPSRWRGPRRAPQLRRHRPARSRRWGRSPGPSAP